MHEEPRELLQFPCNFPIKIVGRANFDFEAKILGIIRKHSPDLGEGAVTIRHSKEKNYMAITAIIPAKSKQQIDDLYRELTSEETVLVVL